MTTAEQAGGASIDPEGWELVGPTGSPDVDLPPPDDHVPIGREPARPPVPSAPELDHVPFDMDFIARTLAKVIGESPFESVRGANATIDHNPQPDPNWQPTAHRAPEPIVSPPPSEVERPMPAAPVPVPAPVVAPAPAPASVPAPPRPAPPRPAQRDPLPKPLTAPAPKPPPPPPPRPAFMRRRASEPDGRAQQATDLLGADGRLFRAAPPKQAGQETGPLRGVRVALRTLLRQRRRMLLSIVAVALGVGYLAGSLSLLQRVGAGLAAQAGTGTERADLVIEGTIADDGPLQQVRKLVPDAIAAQVRNVPGIAAVEPRLESKSTLIINAAGKPVVGLGLTERPLGANYPTEASLNPYRFVGDGRAPVLDNEVVIDQGSAAAAEVDVGGEVIIAGKIGVKKFVVTGIVTLTNGTLPAGSSLALFDTEIARQLFELGPDDNAIAIKLAPGADRDEVTDRLRAIVFSGAEVSTGEQYAEHRAASFEKSFTLIRALLVGFAALALVVGAFTVANSMALLFDHRRRGFAMLRLMGGSPSQLVGAATAESLIGGVIAGVLGLGLGLGVGAAIEHLIQSMGTPLPTAGPLITWWIPVLAVLIGAAVTVSTALSPARHASRTPPVHAVTGADDRPADRPLVVTAARWAATVVVLAVASAIAASAFGGSSVAPLAAGAGAAVGLVLVVLPRLLSGVVGFATALLLGKSVALRRMSTLRSRQARTRASSTTAALLLASAVVTSLTVLSSSFLASIEGQVTEAITADLVVDSATFATGGLSADLVPVLRETPGVEAVSGWRVGAASIGTTLWRAAGIDGATMFDLLDLDTVGTPPPSAGIDDVVISQELADREGLATGDMVPVRFQNNAVVEMRVRAVFRSNVRILLGDIIVDATVMAQNLPQSIDVMAFVNLAPDAPASTRADIESIVRKYGASNVLKPSQLVSKRADLLRGFARVIQWMLAFSIILALVGVANTLQLGVNERRRELGLIRAVGATREQVLRLVLAEAGALSVVGTLFGMVIGAGAAWATVQGLSGFGLDRFVAPVSTLLVVAVVAIGLGLVGAILPALRAAKIPLLDAIADSSDDTRSTRRPRAPRGNDARPTAIVGAPGAPAPGGGSPTPNDGVTMALRCYNCGNEPGDAEVCVACGAPQTITPVGMFTLRPDPEVAATPGAPTAAPTNGTTASTLGADIVDAAVVEDGVVVDPTIPVTAAGSVPPPPPPAAPAYVATAPIDDTPRPATPSILDSRPTPSEQHDPMRSPFGQHEQVRSEPEPEPVEPVAERPKKGIFSAGTAEPSPEAAATAEAPVAPTRPIPSGPPPAFAQAVGAAPSSADHHAATHLAPGFSGSTQPDSHGLAAAVSRLGAAAQQLGIVPFSIAGALLEADERVLGAVAGTSLGMPTVIVVTPTRALIVSDRRYVPEVEIFQLGAGLTIHGRHANDQASLTFTDTERLITVDQIVDVGVAVELANTARNRTVGGDF